MLGHVHANVDELESQQINHRSLDDHRSPFFECSVVHTTEDWDFLSMLDGSFKKIEFKWFKTTDLVYMDMQKMHFHICLLLYSFNMALMSQWLTPARSSIERKQKVF